MYRVFSDINAAREAAKQQASSITADGVTVSPGTLQQTEGHVPRITLAADTDHLEALTATALALNGCPGWALFSTYIQHLGGSKHVLSFVLLG